MPQEIGTNREALDFLYGRVNYERTMAIPYRSGGIKLDRMVALLEQLNNPHFGLPVVHVAGTKGKGSTCHFLDAMARKAGLKVGLFTSPHLECVEERFVLDGRICSREQFVALTNRVAQAVRRLEDLDQSPDKRMSPTFFEITTAMAMVYFAEADVDLAILEVGLGGRLDSTNVCQPLVCIVTSISFDHMKQLGNTLALIAGEKAGIIKSGVPVVSGVVEDEPAQVIRTKAANEQAPLFQWQQDFSAKLEPPRERATDTFSFHWHRGHSQVTTVGPIRLPVPGNHQVGNASMAIAATMLLRERGFEIPDEAVIQGIEQAQLPGRIEIISTTPTVIIDTAHNPASITALCESLQRLGDKPRILIFAVSRDKDFPAMLRTLVDAADHLILTQFASSSRAVPGEELFRVAHGFLATNTNGGENSAKAKLHVAGSPTAAWNFACRIASANDIICVTGSFFLAGELRPVMLQKP